METIALLHNIRSLHNVGSMFRTADGAGISKIYLCGITPSPVDAFGRVREQFKKVSLGAEQYVGWEKQRTTVPLIKKLQHEGYAVVAVEQSPDAIPYDELPTLLINKKRVFIVGNEVKGLPQTVLSLADHVVEIPMHGKKESLNVSVAFGIVAFHSRSTTV